MRKALVVVAVLAASLALCAPAMAWPAAHIPWWHAPHTFTVTGKAKSVDVDASQIVVRVRLASKGVKDYLGEDLTVQVTSHTKLLLAKGRLYKSIKPADIDTGDHLRVVGVIRRATGSPVYVAKRVIVRHVVLPDEIMRFAAAGPVVAVDAVGGNITIHLNRVTRALWLQLGGDLNCKVADNARIWTWTNGKLQSITLSDVAVGDKVVAQGPIDRSDPTSPVYTVNWMRVRPASN
jgi:hypothetical protein